MSKKYIEQYGSGSNAFFCDNRYWDCSCTENYIHVKSKERYCKKCGDCIDEMPASRTIEVHGKLGIKYPKKYLTPSIES